MGFDVSVAMKVYAVSVRQAVYDVTVLIPVYDSDVAQPIPAPIFYLEDRAGNDIIDRDDNIIIARR